MLTMLLDTCGGARGARDARKADFRRQPHRSYLFAARPVVVRGAREMEAVGAPRRGDGGRSPLVRRGPGQGDVERYRPWVSPVSERDVRPYRRDEGPRFEWNYQRGAKPRPTTPELRLADLDRDNLASEIVYGCLMINDLIADAPLRAWSDK